MELVLAAPMAGWYNLRSSQGRPALRALAFRRVTGGKLRRAELTQIEHSAARTTQRLCEARLYGQA